MRSVSVTRDTFVHRANPRLDRIREFLLRNDFDGFTTKDLFIKQFIKRAWGQDIAALSNMAEAITGLEASGIIPRTEAIDLLHRTVSRATHPMVNPWKKPIEAVRNYGHFGYYLEHLNICLGLYLRAGGTMYQELASSVSHHLAAASLAQANAHARLLPHVKMRWCADQAAIIYSLWLCDQNNASELHIEPRNRWLSYMAQHGTHQKSGLYITEVMGRHKYSKQPRGCSHAYMVHYMTHWAPIEAKLQWKLFKEHMMVKRFGLWGFREYLPAFNGRMTPDSGPIIFGVGIAATGLAMKVTADFDQPSDPRRDQMLRNGQRVYRLLKALRYVPLINMIAKIGTDLLASSIMLVGEHRTTEETDIRRSTDDAT